MPHLIFIAKGRDVGMFRLTGLEAGGRALTVGRDVECDLFVPDVFVSRLHCRLEPLEAGNWAVSDARSRNGIRIEGRPVFRRVLRHGDTVEMGTVAFQYDESDLPPTLSDPAPFGSGNSVAALVDTVFTDGLRPGDWIKRNQKKPAWVKAQEEAEAAGRVAEERNAREAAELAERLDFSEPAELDLELQIAAVQRGGDGAAGDAGLAPAEAITPAYVLVPVELARRAYATGDAAAGAPAPAQAAPAGDLATADLAALLPGAAAPPGGAAQGDAPAAPGALSPITSGAPAGAMPGQGKNLWEEAAAAAEKARSAGKRDRRAKPAAAAAAEQAAAKNPAGEPAAGRAMELLRTLRGGYTLGELREDIAARPYRAAGVAAVAAVVAAISCTLYFSRPTYHSPPRLNADGTLNRAFVQGSDN